MKNKKMVPLEKMSKKAQKEFYSRKRSESFGMSMVTRIDKDHSKYDRNSFKKEARKNGYDA